ncbi:hypothetical protein N9H77_02815 [Porticoccaceae bacterium]|jgi:ABC-type siderophore export system fused ATPase/permease subunit|nr:hypothetical protein [bacterium]MDA8866418.1 hypothetical protein [Porticoccaceae bacterium]MDB4559210.1 hypothetical protein [bacterium]
MRNDRPVWLLKWAASITVVIAVLFRSAGEEWHTFDLWFSLIGTTLWLTVSIAWKDRALILLNVTMALFLLKGVIYT